MRLSKWDMVSFHGADLARAASTQAINPDVMILRMFNPRGYIGFNQPGCQQGIHMPFNSSGGSTAGCSIFAGHWLYAPGTTLSSSMSSTTTTAFVNDPSRLKVGQYVVIRPNGSFHNAEHAKVTAINNAAKRITLIRGFKSVPTARPAGAIMAMHQLGLGYAGSSEARLWAFNQSINCPRDGNGRTIGEVMALWLANNLTKNHLGVHVNGVTIDGILFDTDPHFYWNYNVPVDSDNNLIPESPVMISANGTNMWGEGLEDFYAELRSRLPGKIIVGGESISRGFAWINGSELEGWPVNDNGGNINPPYPYDRVDQLLASYTFHLHQHGPGPQYSHGFSRVLTKRYPMGVTPVPTTNAPFRFGFGLALMEDGFYGEDNAEVWPQTVTEKWWDEYAVDVRRGLPTLW